METRFAESTAEFKAHLDERMAQLEVRVDEKTAETARHSSVLAEGLRHEIQQVAKGVVVANQKISGLADQMEVRGRDLRSEIRLVASAKPTSGLESSASSQNRLPS